tara:strand:- start:542 stop:2338 length:1797 start_codon:yes stop_codon:yes gene_type:complete
MDNKDTGNYIKIYQRLWGSLTKKRKKQTIVGGFLILFSAITEMLTLLTLFPLLTILISKNSIIDIQNSNLISRLGIDFGEQSSLLFLTILFISISLFSGFMRLLNSYYNFRLCAAIGNDFGILVFKNVIYRNYEEHIKDSSSSFLTLMSTHVSGAITTMQVSFNLINFFATIIFIVAGMLTVNFKITFLSLIIFASLYLLISFFTRRKIYLKGKFVGESNLVIINYVQEAFGALRDIIIDQSYEFYIQKFLKLNYKKLRAIADTDILVLFPRYIIESFGLSIIAIMAFFSRAYGDSSSLFIPVLGSFALGVQKLLPALHQIYSSYSSLKFNIFSVNKVIDIIDKENLRQNEKLIFDKKSLFFYSSIKFKDVSYRYGHNKYVLRNINLEVKKGEKVGIIGKTGGGKSTLLDLLMGLLNSTKGQILIDNKVLDISSENDLVKTWRSIISHVPQDIFLSDSNFLNNIAFGVETNNIDFQRVQDVSKIAKIFEFIISTKDNFYSRVGERGIQLSGGQRQRIGIARALYRDSKVIILDEATSALDNLTEKAVMESILNFNPELTIIMVAHRLSSLEACDKVIYLKDGQIEMIGNPEDILPKFR